MSSILARWIKAYETRMDQALIARLYQHLRFLHYLPHQLQPPIEYLTYPLLKIPVLLQWERQHIHCFTQLEQPLNEIGLRICDTFTDIHTCAVSINIYKLIKLLSLREIRKIYLDRCVQTCLHVAIPTIQAPSVWASSNQGEKATIAILDTGITPHPDLDSRIIAFQDFIDGKTAPYDDNGHGTHVAGIIAGSGMCSQGKYRGVAPKAKLIGIKVLSKYGESNISAIIKGIYWCIINKNKFNIRVISLSLGSSSELSYREDPLCLMAELAWQAGIVVVAAAGNDGPKAQTITSPGNHPRIITVGASNDQRTVHLGDDQVASFSSRGPTIDGLVKPDLLAPGTNIISLRSKGSYLDRLMQENCVDQEYFYLSGTSMATPIASGVVALLLTKNPHLQPDSIKKYLISSAISLNSPRHSEGFGQIDAMRALLKSI